MEETKFPNTEGNLPSSVDDNPDALTNVVMHIGSPSNRPINSEITSPPTLPNMPTPEVSQIPSFENMNNGLGVVETSVNQLESNENNLEPSLENINTPQINTTQQIQSPFNEVPPENNIVEQVTSEDGVQIPRMYSPLIQPVDSVPENNTFSGQSLGLIEPMNLLSVNDQQLVPQDDLGNQEANNSVFNYFPSEPATSSSQENFTTGLTMPQSNTVNLSLDNSQIDNTFGNFLEGTSTPGRTTTQVNFNSQSQSNFGQQPQSDPDPQSQSNFGQQTQSDFNPQSQSNFGQQPQSNFGQQTQSNFGQPQSNFGQPQSTATSQTQPPINFNQPQSNFGQQSQTASTPQTQQSNFNPPQSNFNPSQSNFNQPQISSTPQTQQSNFTQQYVQQPPQQQYVQQGMNPQYQMIQGNPFPFEIPVIEGSFPLENIGSSVNFENLSTETFDEATEMLPQQGVEMGAIQQVYTPGHQGRTMVTHINDKNYPNKVYIGRAGYGHKASIYANPFNVKSKQTPTIDDVVLAYYKHVISPMGEKIRQNLPQLKGQMLGCWCKRKGPDDDAALCHGDVLVYLLEGTATPNLQRLLTSQPEVKTQIQTQTNYLNNDKVLGSLLGLATGDALGVPHSHVKMSSFTYTGRLEHRFVYRNVRSKASEGKAFAVGQYSDSTETTLALARTLISNKSYNPNHAIIEYIEWGASAMPLITPIMKELVKNDKPQPIQLKTYITRYSKRYTLDPMQAFYAGRVPYNPIAESSQDNSSLIRCMPLACIGTDANLSMKAIERDCWLTNPSSVNVDCSIVFLSCIRMALIGHPADVIYQVAQTLPQTNEVKQIFYSIGNNSQISFTEDKAALTSFYFAMRCLGALVTNPELTYASLINFVVSQGGNTHYNAACSGALAGAIIGYEKLMQDPVTAYNFNMTVNSTSGSMPTDVQRPQKYRLTDIIQIAEGLTSLGAIAL